MLPTLPTIHNAAALDELAQPLRGVSSAARLLDVLSDFAPGQKLVALIQAQLPNGSYRAAIGQRDVTLALPFAARPGDALELKVVEHKGRVAFAVTTEQVEAADPEYLPPDAGRAPAAVAARLSQAGQTIAHLLAGDDGETPPAVPLNGGRPILAAPSVDGGEIAPALREAVASSGLFYESHLAQWNAGDRDATRLAAEPQARFAGAPAQKSAEVATAVDATVPPPARAEPETPPLIREHFGMRPPRTSTDAAGAPAGSPPGRPAAGATATTSPNAEEVPVPPGQGPAPAPPRADRGPLAPDASPGSAPSPLPAAAPTAGRNLGASGLAATAAATDGPASIPVAGSGGGALPDSALPDSAPRDGATPAPPALRLPAGAIDPETRELPLRAQGGAGDAAGLAGAPARAGSLPGELAPLVQQQLLSLANHHYPLHGALWPGQKIEWEIVDEDARRPREQDADAPRQWKTRLKLLLPSLGGIDATIELDASDVRVRIDTRADTEARLRSKVELLGRRLENAGLRLTGVDFKSAAANEPAPS